MPRKRSRVYRSREEIRSILAELEASGLSQKAFGELVAIHPSLLGQWIRRERREQRSLVRVEVKPESAINLCTGSGVEVAVRGERVIRVDAGFDEETFVRVARALERC